MLNLPASVRVLLALEPCDMRKSYNGLSAIAREGMKENPRSGALFLFTNKRRNRMKVLYCDGTGMWVMGKRLDIGRFSWPCGMEVRDGKLELSRRALALLLEGVELEKCRKKSWYEG